MKYKGNNGYISRRRHYESRRGKRNLQFCSEIIQSAEIQTVKAAK
jgi:hypothetical protein